MRLISSPETAFVKIVMPLVLIGGTAIETITWFVEHRNGLPRLPARAWLVYAIALAMTALISWLALRIKRVSMTKSDLHISNLLREVIVPLGDIDAVTESWWAAGHPVTVRFTRRTDFGHAITFLPKRGWVYFLGSHPIVDELRRAADAARTTLPAR